jgi:hypothetical protein
MQSHFMEPNWAEENLQTIRTLMERSAVYRRALAPIMLFAGVLGILAAATGLLFHLDSTRAFGVLWLGTAVFVIVGAFLIARRQALKDSEKFWSPPTRRIAQALLPPLTAGTCVGLVIVGVADRGLGSGFNLLLTLVWLLFYGCALHSAGVFMPRGMKLFGWIFIVLACGILCFFVIVQPEANLNEHWLMGFFFGVLHLAYGAYLYLTEKGKNAA